MTSRERLGGPIGGPIAYIVKMYPRLSETFITNEITELRRRGVDLRIVSLMEPSGTVHSQEALALRAQTFTLPRPGSWAGFRAILRDHRDLLRRGRGRYVHALWLVTRRCSRSAWKRFFQAGAVACFCLREEVSHLHGAFAHNPASVAWWTSRLTGIPFSFAAHAKDLYLSDRRSLRRKIDAARFVWTCTEANGRFLRSLGSSTPVHVGYHGCDLSRFRSPHDRDRPEEREKRILSVGRQVPKKGLDDLVRAGALLRKQGLAFRLVFIGDGIERPRLEGLASRLGVADRVDFLGSLPPRAVIESYARADLLVLPSVVLENGDRDGIPNVLVEAMAMGVPVISTRISAIPELIEDGRNGLLVAPRRPDRLADAIVQSFDDPDATRARAARARRDVEERFDLHRNSERLARLLDRHRRPTRCLYVCGDLGVPIRGHKGASAHVRQVAGRLAAMGIDLRVVTPNPGPPPPAGNRFDLPIEEVVPPAWTIRRAKELRRLLHNIPVGRRVARLLREIRPDFVYERYSLCAIASGLACRRRRIPWLLEVNAPLADEEERFRALRWRRLTRALERWILRHADHLFVVSHALRRWAMEHGVAPDRITVLPNGVDLSRFHRGIDGSAARRAWGWGDRETIVGFAGSLKPWHGAEVLLRSFEKAVAKETGLRLVFIGEGPQRERLERRVSRKGLEPVVRFTGAVAHEAVPSLLRATDILAAPYLPQDGFYFSPMKILEYMAVGRPVVASRIGDIPAWVEPDCGLLVPPGDESALCESLLSLARDREKARWMGRRGAARAAKEDWSRRIDRIVERAVACRLESPATTPRVGYVLKMFPRFSETFIVNEIIELERQGIDVRVFSMKQPEARRQEDADRVRARVTVLPRGPRFLAPSVIAAHARGICFGPAGYIRALAFAVGRGNFRAVSKFIQAGVIADAARRERIGHLHAHFASGPARVAKLASMISGLPYSFTAHAKDLYWEGHRHEQSHKLKKRIKLARFVVAVSRENQRFLEGLGFRIKEGRIRTVHIGLRLGQFPFRRPSARPVSPRPLILAVGRLIEKKGFHVLADACALLRDQGIPFRCLIVGEGPERENLQQRIERLGLSGSVRLLGAVSLSRLRRGFYSRARVLALPCVIARDGDRDGIPTVILEAMASGVPVISTRLSGIPEAIEDGVNGFLTDPGEVEPLAERIAQILVDPALADSLAERGRERVEMQFGVKRNAGALRKLFLRSLAGWPSPAAEEEETTVSAAEATGAPDGVAGEALR